MHRIDKFAVPAGARSEFLERVRETHALLRTQPGFIRDLVLEQTDGPGRFNIVTLVSWQDSAAVENAKAAVAAARAETGFDPQALIARLGIEADLANYTEISD